MILKMTEFLRENRPDFDAAREKAKAYDQAAWEAKINEVYGASASSIIALEHESQKNEVNGRLKRIDAIEAHWDEIVKLMDDNMPTAVWMLHTFHHRLDSMMTVCTMQCFTQKRLAHVTQCCL